MKKILFLVCSLSYGFITAQDCTRHLLMQKGVQLEYREYWINVSGNIPIARVLLEVDKVTDSAGRTWSSITKRVYSNRDSNDHYQRNLVLQCDGKNLLFPYDLYFTDTIYRRDFYPNVYSDKYNYSVAYTQLKDAITYIVPLAADCIVALPESKKEVDLVAIVSYPPSCMPRAYNVETVNINSIILQGREKVTTAAGDFNCYNFCMELKDNGKPILCNLYYNKEAGFVKLEDYRRYVELINIRK